MDIAELGLSIRSDGVVIASDRLKRFGQDASSAEQSANRLGDAFRRFAPIIGAVTAALSVRALKAYADSWSDMQSRVGAAVKNMEAAPALMNRLVDVANASYSPLNQTVEVYGRNVAVLRDLGKGAVEAADFTEALNHALVTTATKGQDADVVLNALSRAISIGGLRAMEYETIMSRSPRVLEAVAKEMGTTTTGLRALAQQGKVTGTVIVDGLVKSLNELRKEAGEMPATIGDAMVRLDTNFGALVGRIDQATGISASFAEQLIWVADTMRAWTDDIVRAAIVLQTGFNAAIEWASTAASTLGASFDTASAMIVAGAGVAGIAVAALTTAIVGGLINAVIALGLALAANPFALFVGAIAAAVTASYLFRDEIKQTVGVDLFDVFKQTANLIIGVMVGAYDAVVAAWGALPGEFGKLGKLAANALMDALGGLTIDWKNPFTGEITRLVDFSFKDLKYKLDESESKAMDLASAAYEAAQGIDYIGNASGALKTAWDNADGAVAAFEGLANAGGKAAKAFDPKAAKEAQKAAKAYKEIVEGATEFIRAQELEASVIGMTEQAANALRYEQDLLNEARRAGLKLTDADRQGFKALAEAMAEAEERTRVLTERFDFMKDLTKGFFNDFKNDLISNMSQGMSFWDAAWKAMGKAALNVLDKIVDKLLNDVLDALLQVNGAGGGGGGLLGNLLGGMLGMQQFPGGMGFATPGYVGTYHTGGVVGSAAATRAADPTWFIGAPRYHRGGIAGLAGDEVPAILRRGEIVSRDMNHLRQQAGNQNYANQNQPAPYVDNRVYNFTGTSEEFQQFKEFVVQRDAEFDQRAVGAVKGYYGAGNSI